MLRKSSCKDSGETPCCTLDGESGCLDVRPTSITTRSAKSRNATSSACRWDASAGPRATEAVTNPVTNLNAPKCFICRNSHWTEARSTWKKITLPERDAFSEIRLCGYTDLRQSASAEMRATSPSKWLCPAACEHSDRRRLASEEWVGPNPGRAVMPDPEGHAGEDGDDGRTVRERDGAFNSLPPRPTLLCRRAA